MINVLITKKKRFLLYCRSEIFEFTSFARLNVQTNLQMTLSCEVDYCTSSTDGECFVSIVLNDWSGSNGYSACFDLRFIVFCITIYTHLHSLCTHRQSL